MDIRIKRIYDPPSGEDGLRVLVDRLWPRGLSRREASIELWVSDLAPSAQLRKWFHRDPSRFDEFRSRYLEELEDRRPAARQLLLQRGGRAITLLFASRDRFRNHAVILRDFLSAL